MFPAEGLGHILGTDGRAWYDFWSGLGADLGELAIIGAVAGMYRKHNCHVHRCWRLAKQPVTGTSWVVCHRHHPEGKPTVASIAEADRRHHEALAARETTEIAQAAATHTQDGRPTPKGPTGRRDE